MYKDINFNENEPSINNIDYVLSKVLFCLTSASMYEEYVDLRIKIENELKEFIELLNIYINSKNLLNINFNKLNDLASNISTLDCETVAKDGLYLEMAEVWLSILIGYYNILRKEK